MAEFFELGLDQGCENKTLLGDLLTRPAEEFGNDASIEAIWAIKAYQHAEVYFNLLRSVDLQFLKLTPHDDKIYSDFREKFPDLNVDIVDVESLKSAQAKELWRPFCNSFESVEDFNFGTLLRLNSSMEYSEENSIIVPRIQFYAIEIARNREGINAPIRQNYKTDRGKV